MTPCAGVCGASVSDACDFCARCVRGMERDVRRLQGLAPGQLVILADIFSTCGADTLTRLMISVLPFDNTPMPLAEMDRLTDE
jgi:hypothetical protein